MAIIHLGRALPRASSGLPWNSGEQPSNVPLRGLAPNGVFRAADVTASAVGSYPTFSPLPKPLARLGRFVFCGTFLEVSLTGRYPAFCSVEPGLSSLAKTAERSPLLRRPPARTTRMGSSPLEPVAAGTIRALWAGPPRALPRGGCPLLLRVPLPSSTTTGGVGPGAAGICARIVVRQRVRECRVELGPVRMPSSQLTAGRLRARQVTARQLTARQLTDR